MLEPSREEITIALEAECTCVCAFCRADEHYRCFRRKCGIGPLARRPSSR